MVFLDFLFHNSGDELNFPFTIKMFQKLSSTKISHLEFSIFALLMRNMEKNVRNWLLEGIKNMDEKLIYWIIFNFALIRGFFLNIWLSKWFNRDLLTDFKEGPRGFSRTNFSVRWSLTCTWTCYFSKIVALTWNRFPPNSDANIPFWNYYFEIAAVAIYVLNN